MTRTVREAFDTQTKAFNSHDLAGFADTLADDVVFRALGGIAGAGKVACAQFFGGWLGAFPDAHVQIHDLHIAGDVAAEEGEFAGTHHSVLHSPAGDVPATGRPVTDPWGPNEPGAAVTERKWEGRMDRLPIVHVRGYAGPTAGIDVAVDDPFYGFNAGATHVRVGGDGDPMFYQFEGPLLRLMTDEGYQLLVHGDQHRFLLDVADSSAPAASLWVYRFYDQAATTFMPPPHENVVERLFRRVHQQVTADGFDIESAAAGLNDLIMLIRAKTGAPRVCVAAHSMGGLVARCMMQKICLLPDADGRDREPARNLVARLFTYGTPHGGIAFKYDALEWMEQAFGPAGSDIFALQKMYGYLNPKATFGDLPPAGRCPVP